MERFYLASNRDSVHGSCLQELCVNGTFTLTYSLYVDLMHRLDRRPASVFCLHVGVWLLNVFNWVDMQMFPEIFS